MAAQLSNVTCEQTKKMFFGKTTLSLHELICKDIFHTPPITLAPLTLAHSDIFVFAPPSR